MRRIPEDEDFSSADIAISNVAESRFSSKPTKRRTRRALSVTSLGIQGDLVPLKVDKGEEPALSPWLSSTSAAEPRETDAPLRPRGRVASVSGSLLGIGAEGIKQSSDENGRASPRGFQVPEQVLRAWWTRAKDFKVPQHFLEGRKKQYESDSGIFPKAPPQLASQQALACTANLVRLKLGGSYPILSCIEEKILSSVSLFASQSTGSSGPLTADALNWREKAHDFVTTSKEYPLETGVVLREGKFGLALVDRLDELLQSMAPPPTEGDSKRSVYKLDESRCLALLVILNELELHVCERTIAAAYDNCVNADKETDAMNDTTGSDSPNTVAKTNSSTRKDAYKETLCSAVQFPLYSKSTLFLVSRIISDAPLAIVEKSLQSKRRVSVSMFERQRAKSVKSISGPWQGFYASQDSSDEYVLLLYWSIQLLLRALNIAHERLEIDLSFILSPNLAWKLYSLATVMCTPSEETTATRENMLEDDIARLIPMVPHLEPQELRTSVLTKQIDPMDFRRSAASAFIRLLSSALSTTRREEVLHHIDDKAASSSRGKKTRPVGSLQEPPPALPASLSLSIGSLIYATETMTILCSGGKTANLSLSDDSVFHTTLKFLSSIVDLIAFQSSSLLRRRMKQSSNSVRDDSVLADRVVQECFTLFCWVLPCVIESTVSLAQMMGTRHNFDTRGVQTEESAFLAISLQNLLSCITNLQNVSHELWSILFNTIKNNVRKTINNSTDPLMQGDSVSHFSFWFYTSEGVWERIRHLRSKCDSTLDNAQSQILTSLESVNMKQFPRCDVELSLEEPHRTDVLEEYKADCLAVFGEEIPTTNGYFHILTKYDLGLIDSENEAELCPLFGIVSADPISREQRNAICICVKQILVAMQNVTRHTLIEDSVKNVVDSFTLSRRASPLNVWKSLRQQVRLSPPSSTTQDSPSSRKNTDRCEWQTAVELLATTLPRSIESLGNAVKLSVLREGALGEAEALRCLSGLSSSLVRKSS